LRKGRVSLPGQIYHVTAATMQRKPVFSDFDLACAAARAFADRSVLGDASLLSWVLMPDHAHWLLQLGGDALPALVNRLKCASARHVNRVCGTTGPVWARAYHDHAVRRDEDVRVLATYIIANPLRAGLVERVADYPFWDACWL
jgi:putative transposase